MKYNNDKFQNTLAYVRAELCVKNEIIRFFWQTGIFFYMRCVKQFSNFKETF